MADFTAQMHQVVRACQAQCAGFHQRRQHIMQTLQAKTIGLDITNGDGIEHGGDARGNHLGIVGQHRRSTRPLHTGPRYKVLFHIVGVQFDEAG